MTPQPTDTPTRLTRWFVAPWLQLLRLTRRCPSPGPARPWLRLWHARLRDHEPRCQPTVKPEES